MLVSEKLLYGPEGRAWLRWPWKAIAMEGAAPVLYRIDQDPGETPDVAAQHGPELDALRELGERERPRAAPRRAPPRSMPRRASSSSRSVTGTETPRARAAAELAHDLLMARVVDPVARQEADRDHREQRDARAIEEGQRVHRPGADASERRLRGECDQIEPEARRGRSRIQSST